MKSPSPPLNCYSGLANDDFAGWYAVKEKTKCNDFCYWKQPPSTSINESDDRNGTSTKTTLPSTADPHQTTITKTNAKWVCLMNGAGDETTFDDIIHADDNPKIHTKVFYDENILRFNYLQCSRGAGELLHSNGQIVMESVVFWSIMIVLCLILYIAQIRYILLQRSRQTYVQCAIDNFHDDLQMNLSFENNDNESRLSNSYNKLQMSNSTKNKQEQQLEEEGGEKCTILGEFNQNERNDMQQEKFSTEESISPDPISNVELNTEQTSRINSNSHQNCTPEDMNALSSKCMNITSCVRKIRCCSKQKCILIVTIIMDVFLLCVLFIATLVIIEINQKLDLPFELQVLTAPCSNTQLLCPAGNVPIDKSSSNDNNLEPFSYIIASDPQLDWYDGESAYMGSLTYPPPCSSKDSCGSCTKKLGMYTNQQMKKSIEKLVNGRVQVASERATTTAEESPTPKTLVLNGDLTQYFHRHERKKYESICHNLDGVEQFFPGLGNHDYDQFNGATYNFDEWVGPHYCNGKHSVSYLKGAFCNKIPNFNAKERLTRYDPGSLSYSWDQGHYHFVLVHYYPTYENAGLGISSSIEWLEQDLHLANEKNKTSVLYVHASLGLPEILEKTMLETNVAVIFTGHIHRCLGNKCELVRGLNSHEAEEYLNMTALGDNSTSNDDRVEKCFPASAILCSRRANGNGLFYLKDMSTDLKLPERKLFSAIPVQRGLCPVPEYGPYLNEIENSSLCKRQSVSPQFPRNPKNVGDKTIPIFWSGSASFETFLVADFYNDRIVINVMTATEGNEGERYVDVNSIPNAIYPFHTKSDLEEKVIYV